MSFGSKSDHVKLMCVLEETHEAVTGFAMSLAKACAKHDLNPAVGSIAIATDFLECCVKAADECGVGFDLVGWAKLVMSRVNKDEEERGESNV